MKISGSEGRLAGGAWRIVAVAALLAPAALLHAQAQSEAPKAMLTVYAEGVEGPTVMQGRYADVIAHLSEHPRHFAEDAVSASTNLCVAYVMTRQWREAHDACDKAILMARLDARETVLYARTRHAEQMAIAYSNRAVLHWLEAQPADAASDMAHARSLAPKSQEVVQNLALLAAHPSG